MDSRSSHFYSYSTFVFSALQLLCCCIVSFTVIFICLMTLLFVHSCGVDVVWWMDSISAHTAHDSFDFISLFLDIPVPTE